MGVMGQMFPGPKIADEAGESGTGEPAFRLGPIDLDSNTVTLVRGGEATDGFEAHVGVDTGGPAGGNTDGATGAATDGDPD